MYTVPELVTATPPTPIGVAVAGPGTTVRSRPATTARVPAAPPEALASAANMLTKQNISSTAIPGCHGLRTIGSAPDPDQSCVAYSVRTDHIAREGAEAAIVVTPAASANR